MGTAIFQMMTVLREPFTRRYSIHLTIIISYTYYNNIIMKYLCQIPEQNKKDKIIKGQKKLPWQSIYIYMTKHKG